jgi:NaMN:DMB phosphoribosyltransferase
MKDGQASRRGFFKAVVVGGATTAAAVATVVVGDRKSATATADPDAPKQTGYRETAHIQQYYRTTKV